jgi:lysozyme
MKFLREIILQIKSCFSFNPFIIKDQLTKVIPLISKHKMKTSQKGIDLIKKFESLHDGDFSLIGLQPKMCPAGIWTEGYGHAIIDPNTGEYLKGKEYESLARKLAFIKNPSIDDYVEAEALLKEDLKSREEFLNSLWFPEKLTQNKFDALISLIFNIGEHAFEESTVCKYMKDNINDPRISQAFLMWINVNKVPLRGLALRRLEEAILYLPK